MLSTKLLNKTCCKHEALDAECVGLVVMYVCLRVAAHTDEISDILKSRIFHTDTATVSNFTSIYTEIHEKCHKKFVAVSASEVLTCV